MLAFKLTPTKGWDVHAFAYAVDEQETPQNSWQHRGLRTTLDYANVLADVSAVEQSDYADGSSADADYRDFQLGYHMPWLTIKAQHETLEPGFKTPLATLHAFNGWADRFLATPAAGLVDRNLKLLGSIAQWSWLLAAHRFEADEGSADFGEEINASLSYKFAGNVSVLLKYADYRGDTDAPTLPYPTLPYPTATHRSAEDLVASAMADVAFSWAPVRHSFCLTCTFSDAFRSAPAPISRLRCKRIPD